MLLAESLKQQDRQSEILTKHSEILIEQGEILTQRSTLLTKLVESDERQNLLLEKLVDGQSVLSQEIKHLRGDVNKLVDFLQNKQDKPEERVKRIEPGRRADKLFFG